MSEEHYSQSEVPVGPRKECCRVESNLGEPEVLSDVLSFRRCSVCQCRHFEAIADPADLKALFAGMS